MVVVWLRLHDNYIVSSFDRLKQMVVIKATEILGVIWTHVTMAYEVLPNNN
jgi:hypothetical protein